jgi:hypothetical protein
MMPSYPFAYFKLHRKEIIDLFGPSVEVQKRLESKYREILEHPKTVAVHVRTYSPNLTIHWCLGADYFERAMSYFSNDHLFVIFSDRIDWCKKYLHLEGREVRFMENNSHIDDLYLIAACKNVIMSNSTFSWWGAYLKDETTGVVLAPEKWFQDEKPSQRKLFYPDSYQILPVYRLDPPTTDLWHFQTKSLGD